MVINSGFFTQNCMKCWKFRLLIHIFNIRFIIFSLEKQYTFLAVYCTLLNNSYLGIYLQNTTTQKTGKKRKKGGMKNNLWSWTQTQHLRLDATTPKHDTESALHHKGRLRKHGEKSLILSLFHGTSAGKRRSKRMIEPH